ncbi:MAG TPA: SecDF P1 head subdomain-containing protein [Candidatus Azoamicus sp.]
MFLKKQILLTGDSVVYASSGFEHSLNKPCINIKISKKNIKEFEAITKKNIGNLMAIIYKENILTPLEKNLESEL